MRELLIKSKEELRANISYIRNGDIFISPDTAFLPAAVKMPAIGIKDGAITHTQINQSVDTRPKVLICIFAENLKGEQTIIGDLPNGKKGILEIAEDVQNVLNDNLLNIGGVFTAFCTGESETVQGVRDNNKIITRKILTFEYIKKR